jgi:hypothetical protein
MRSRNVTVSTSPNGVRRVACRARGRRDRRDRTFLIRGEKAAPVRDDRTGAAIDVLIFCTTEEGDDGRMLKTGGVTQNWTAFGTTMLTLVGALNVSEGTLVGFARSGVGFNRGEVAFTTAGTWAAATITLGALLALTGLALHTGRASARLAAVSVVALHAVTQLALLQAYPTWSLLMVTLDVIIVFALTVPRQSSTQAGRPTGPAAIIGTSVVTYSGTSAAPPRTILRRNARSDTYRARHKAGQVSFEPAPSIAPGAVVKAIGQAPVSIEDSNEPVAQPIPAPLPIPAPKPMPTPAPLPEPVPVGAQEPYPLEVELVRLYTDETEIMEVGELATAGARPYVT